MKLIARMAAPLLAVVIAACTTPGSTPPSAATVLRQASNATAGLHSVNVDAKFGPGIVVQGVTLSSATSKIQLPDNSDTTFKVKQGDFLVDLRVVTISGQTYIRLPFSGFTPATAEEARVVPNLAKLLNQQTGLPAVMPQGSNASYLGTEQIAGTDCDKVSATYAAAQVGQILGVQPAGDIKATIWAGRSDHYVRRVVLSGPLLKAGQVVQIEVDLHDFNQPVIVATPSPIG